MALPVIANVFRCTINGTAFGGVTPHNVFHVSAPAVDEAEVGAALVAACQDGQMACVKAGHEPASFTVLALDGTSAGQLISRDPGDPQMCLASGDSLPELAAVLRITTARRGARGRGRLFLGPLVEDEVENGILDVTGDNGDIPAKWATFASELAGSGITMGIASYAHADFHAITGLALDQHVGTQRRRLLQTR